MYRKVIKENKPQNPVSFAGADSYRAYKERGMERLKNNQPAEAVLYFTKAIEAQPDNYSAYYRRGLAYSKAGDYEKAIIDFTKAIELNPSTKNPDQPWDYYKNTCEESGDQAKVLAELKKEQEHLYLAYYQRGLAYYEQKDYQKAIADLTETIKANSKSWGSYYQRGLAYKETGMYRVAWLDFTKIIDARPLDYGAYYERGLVSIEAQNYDTAWDDFTVVINAKPDSYGAYYQRGLASKGIGDYEKALDDLTNAIELNPFTEARKLNPDQPLAYYQLIHNKSGDQNKVLANFNKERNHLCSAYYARGLTYKKQKDYKKALDDFTEIIDLQPAGYWGYYECGRIYELTGDLQQALKYYTHAIDLCSDYKLAYLRRSHVYAKLGMTTESLTDQEKSKNISARPRI